MPVIDLAGSRLATGVSPVRIHYREAGAGPPLVFLHSGWGYEIERHSRAWQRIAEEAASGTDDFYGGRLGEIEVPVLVVHGARDPRTEPGEIDALVRALHAVRGVRLQANHPDGHVRGAKREVVVLPDGGHSPHSEPVTADEVSRIARPFIDAALVSKPFLPAPPAL